MSYSDPMRKRGGDAQVTTDQTTDVATQLFTTAEEFIGKIVTLVNVKSPTTMILKMYCAI